MYSITLVLIVTRRSMSLATWTFLGPTVDDEIRAWNLTQHSGVWFSANLPSGIRKSAPRRLDLDFLDSSSASPSSDPRRLHTLFSPLNHSLFQHPSHSGTDLTTNQDKKPRRPNTTDQTPKTSPLICTGISPL
jgi:hypothetical protein